MTTSGHRATDPTISARDSIEAPVAPVLARRGGLRGRAGLIAVAVGAIVVVAMGLGFGGPGPMLDANAPPSASGAAAALGASGVVATGLPGSGCLPVDPADVPEIRLLSTDGGSSARLGVAAADEPAFDVDVTTGGWPVPGASSAIALGVSASLVLIPEEKACVRRTIVEYVAADAIGDPPVPLGPGDGTFSRSRARVVLGGLPSGDWIVRVVARYSTGDPAIGDEDLPAIERFFRVASAERPAVTPLVTPAVACGELPRGGRFPSLFLVYGDGEPVRGIDPTTFPGDRPLVRGAVPGTAELRVEGDACATSWTIDLLDPTQGFGYTQYSQDNPLENPAYVSQNRIVLEGLPLGRTIVRASVTFEGRQSLQAEWELEIVGPPVPDVSFSGARGSQVAGLPGCGTGWSFQAGESAFEFCPGPSVPTTLNVLIVRDGEVVTVDMPGWTIESWSGWCGTRGPMPGELVQGAECGLGGQGDGSTPTAGPARFVPFPGRTISGVWLSAVKDGIRVYAQYYAEIVVEP